jgi:hypothetical protein
MERFRRWIWSPRQLAASRAPRGGLTWNAQGSALGRGAFALAACAPRRFPGEGWRERRGIAGQDADRSRGCSAAAEGKAGKQNGRNGYDDAHVLLHKNRCRS